MRFLILSIEVLYIYLIAIRNHFDTGWNILEVAEKRHFLLQIVIFCRNAGGRRYLPIEQKFCKSCYFMHVQVFISIRTWKYKKV